MPESLVSWYDDGVELLDCPSP